MRPPRVHYNTHNQHPALHHQLAPPVAFTGSLIGSLIGYLNGCLNGCLSACQTVLSTVLWDGLTFRGRDSDVKTR
jgi:hypothetical protein